MFILRDDNEPLQWPVKISRPVSGGKTEQHGFTAHFRVMRTDQLEPLGLGKDRDLLRAILVGWEEDLVDEHNQPIPYSDDMRDRLCNVPYIKSALFAAYWEMMSGREAKN